MNCCSPPLVFADQRPCRIAAAPRPTGTVSRLSENCELDELDELDITTDDYGITALVMNCIDFRLIADTARLMDNMGYKNDYDNFVLPGASAGVMNNAWTKTFDDTVDIAVALHKIKKVIVIDHMDCGYYRALYGQTIDAETERKHHIENLHRMVDHLQKYHPTLKVEGWLMNLDGSAVQYV